MLNYSSRLPSCGAPKRVLISCLFTVAISAAGRQPRRGGGGRGDGGCLSHREQGICITLIPKMIPLPAGAAMTAAPNHNYRLLVFLALLSEFSLRFSVFSFLSLCFLVYLVFLPLILLFFFLLLPFLFLLMHSF